MLGIAHKNLKAAKLAHRRHPRPGLLLNSRNDNGKKCVSQARVSGSRRADERMKQGRINFIKTISKLNRVPAARFFHWKNQPSAWINRRRSSPRKTLSRRSIPIQDGGRSLPLNLIFRAMSAPLPESAKVFHYWLTPSSELAWTALGKRIVCRRETANVKGIARDNNSISAWFTLSSFCSLFGLSEFLALFETAIFFCNMLITSHLYTGISLSAAFASKCVIFSFTLEKWFECYIMC